MLSVGSAYYERIFIEGQEILIVQRKEVKYVIRRHSLLGANISLKGKKDSDRS